MRNSFFFSSVVAAAAALLGCGGSSGGVGQDCYPNGTCNIGLSCTAGKCATGGSDAGTDAGVTDLGGGTDLGTDAGGGTDLGTDAGAPDAGPTPCDPYTELDETATSACGAGMRCAHEASDGSYRCAPMGEVPINGYCSLRSSGLDDCSLGSDCVEPGICEQRCIEGTSSCYPGRSCFGQPPDLHGYCYDDCDVFAPGVCGPGNFCDVLPNGRGTYIASCTSGGGQRAIGEPCTDSGLCSTGVCGVSLPSTPSINCLAVCDATHHCATGTCTPFADTTTPGLGYCLP